MLAANRSLGLCSIVALGTFLASPLAFAQPSPNDPLAAPPPGETAPPAPPPPPSPPGGLKIEGSNASMKLGFLIQPAYEFAGATNGVPTMTGTRQVAQGTQAFFLRRARLMIGMTLGDHLELFAETDNPNLGRATTGGVAGSTGTQLQDAFVTWKFTDAPLKDLLKIDVGMMLIPFSHNGLQGATTLYAWDYFAYSFLQTPGMTNFAGRDTGVQVRGLALDKHLEYRAGLFQGRRAFIAPTAAMPTPVLPNRTAMRLAARVQYNVFDPETAYFYAGTYGGAKKILSFGANVDYQNDYLAWGVDGFLDLPLGDDVLTAQANFLHLNGGSWIPALAKQNDFVIEAGYRLGAFQISPIARFEMQSLPAATPKNVSVGLAYWFMGHNANFKAFYSYVSLPAPAVSYSQVNLQTQFYVF